MADRKRPRLIRSTTKVALVHQDDLVVSLDDLRAIDLRDISLLADLGIADRQFVARIRVRYSLHCPLVVVPVRLQPKLASRSPTTPLDNGR